MSVHDYIVPELSLIKHLGGGAFGSVWLGKGTRWSYSGKTFVKDKFAVKKIPKGEGSSFTEIEIHTVLGRHPNICYLYDWMERPVDGDPDRIWLIYEYCDSGSINELLMKERVPTDTMIDYMQDITSALVFMHQHRVVHLDIKADNVILTKTKHGFACKICDFGISRFLAEDGRDCYKVTTLSRSCGPLYSSAPEVFQGVRLTDKSDIFSLGLLMLAFFTRSHVKLSQGMKLVTPFLNFRGREGTPIHEATQDEIQYLVESQTKPRFRRMLNKMLHLDYHNRPFAEEVLEWLERLEQQPTSPSSGMARRPSKRLADNQSIISGGEVSGKRNHNRRRVHPSNSHRPGGISSVAGVASNPKAAAKASPFRKDRR